MTDWDARFLSLSFLVSVWSKDPSTKADAAGEMFEQAGVEVTTIYPTK